MRVNLIGVKLLVILTAVCTLAGCQRVQPIDWETRLAEGWQGYDFGTGPAMPHYTHVAASQLYSEAAGYGFQPGGEIQEVAGAAVGNKPFAFQVALPEGTYLVEVTLGNPRVDSVTTVKDEMRRLKLEKVAVPAGKSVTRVFTAHVRRPEYGEGSRVRLKSRERDNEMVLWDENLRIEFTGEFPSVRSITITPADALPVLYLLGDSTVTDQPTPPWNSWGQMLPRFFKPTMAVANFANSGERVDTSLGAGRFAKVYSRLKPGDWVAVQFGHNDMKLSREDKLDFYRKNLTDFIAEVRAHGATPILVTSMERKAGLNGPTLQGYPQAVRDLAAEQNVALVDLNKASLLFYGALGDQLDAAFNDGTHHNNYGSYQLAAIVADGLMKLDTGLEKHLVKSFKGYDPANPPSPREFTLPDSDDAAGETPLGS